jgi:hypothetical protein
MLRRKSTPGSRVKKIIFRGITLLPLLVILATVSYFVFFTNLPQILYSQSVRNLPFDCLEFSSAGYVYKMKPGPCRLRNIEYDVVFTSDANGFRNGIRAPGPYDVAVLGDSHAFGYGVADNQTFADLLNSTYHYQTINLAIGSYATARELDAFSEYGKDAKYVVIQYCPNDYNENEASLRLSKEEFRNQAEANWRLFINSYQQGKALGYRRPLHDLGFLLRHHGYASKSSWRRDTEQARQMDEEAAKFAQVIARYRPLLEGKRLIIFEVAASGMNSPRFESAFAAELGKLDWLSYKLLNSATLLNLDDYFWLDDHINADGHKKLAAAISVQIGDWERQSPVIALIRARRP